MKASKFREMSDQELGNQLKEFKSELFNLRFQMATGQLQNPMAIKECRKNIARVNTILRERELQAAAK
ncbi:MAG: 50S ribosomal protein L29 [Christensenellales bacterium]|jgi:large subunit ribosomal protein L29